MPRKLNFKCSKCPWQGERHANASCCLRCGGRLIREQEATDYERLLLAAEAAYDHLDRYGAVTDRPEVLQSQQNVFDLLRPFVRRPKAGQL